MQKEDAMSSNRPDALRALKSVEVADVQQAAGLQAFGLSMAN